MPSQKVAACAECSAVRPLPARGLCWPCYGRLLYHRDSPPACRPAAESEPSPEPPCVIGGLEFPAAESDVLARRRAALGGATR